MRTMKFISILVVVLMLGICTASVSADTASCLSAVCGLTAPTDYYYGVGVDVNDSLDLFIVGTDDGNLANYSNWTMPAGWTYDIVVNDDDTLYNDPYTDHGLVTDYSGVCAYKIVWSTTGDPLSDGTFNFGFDNLNLPEDVGWVTNNSAADWSAAVAMGEGPVHAPIPEPITLSLLAMGGLVMLRRRKA